MLVFYTEDNSVNSVVSISLESRNISCSNLTKPKTKCCKKYKKKGVNCKRCPLTFDL